MRVLNNMEWYQFLGLIIAFYLMHRESTKETKEFHGRLCTLEQKYIDMMERVLEGKK